MEAVSRWRERWDGLTVAEAATIVTPRPMPWNGTLSGDVMVDFTAGESATLAHAKLSIAPAAQGKAVEGLLDAFYDQHAGEFSFGDLIRRDALHAPGCQRRGWAGG